MQCSILVLVRSYPTQFGRVFQLQPYCVIPRHIYWWLLVSQLSLEMGLARERCCSSLKRALSEILPYEEIGPGLNRPTIPSMWYLSAGYYVEGIVRSYVSAAIPDTYDRNWVERYLPRNI